MRLFRALTPSRFSFLPPLLVLSALLACEHPSPRWPADDSLTLALPNAPLNFDPRVGNDESSAKVFQLLFNGLVTVDPQGNLVPDLATRWEVLDGGRRYRFHLRDGVLFHDGRPFGAQDVVWTYTTLMDGSVRTAKRGAYSMVERLVAVDRLTVDFLLSEPSGSLLADLTPGQGVLPAGMGVEAMNRHPIGTGPFRFLRSTPETVTLAAFDEAWQGRPLLDRLVLKEVPDATVRALELLDGSIQLVVNDLLPDTVPIFRESPYFQVVESPSSSFAYLGFNMEDPLLRDPAVRRALALAIDRQKLVDALWRGLGVVSETILPAGLWATHEELAPLAYDPAAAARLLEEAGYPDPDGDGPQPRIRLSYKTSNNEIYLLQAQVIQSMARQAGIDLEIRSLEFATLYADVSRGSFQIFSMVRTSIVDPNIYRLILHSDAVPPQGQNRGRYRNPEFDRLIDEGNRLATPEERRPYYLEAQEIFARDLPYIPLYVKRNVSILPETLEGYVSYPSGELFSLRQVRWRR